jgi:predicted GH43/DUF377 family glycosyl hydrolase
VSRATLAVGLTFLVAASAHGDPWQLDKVPALIPGNTGTWDSDSIAGASVIRSPEGWTLFYEGTSLNEGGAHPAFGRAMSTDGAHWKKSDQGLAFDPDVGPHQSASGPSVTHWRDGYLMAYVVNTNQVAPDTTFDEHGRVAPVEMRMASSADGIHWRDQLRRKTPIHSQQHFDFEPCLYADGETLHLWWRAPDGEKEMLCHSVSRDGLAWSKPNAQPTNDIDPFPISGVRVYPSGAYYIISYVAHDTEKKTFQLITKLSRDAKTWMRKGPPAFSLPQACAPFLVFTPEGARLFFTKHQRLATGEIASRAELMSAFCPKSAYEGN